MSVGFSVPSGLNEMLQEFVVQCLLEKPNDLVAFAAQYFTALREMKSKHEVTTTLPVAINENNNKTTSDSVNNTSEGATNGMNEVLSESDDDFEPPPRMPVRRRRQAVAAETYDPSDEDENCKRIVHAKSDEQKATLRKVMRNILLFKGCEPEQIHELLDGMFERSVIAGEKVILQGDDGDNFYVIETGTYGVFINTGDGEAKKKVHTFVDSGSFGELALMYNCPRNATIIADTKGILWALDQSVFRRIVVGAAARKRRSYEKLLVGVPMLKELRECERANLADALVSVVFEDGECIIKQGDDADCMYFVEDGNIRIVLEKDGDSKMIPVLKNGDYFGEMALVLNKPRSASVYAYKGPAKCAKLDVDAFERLLGPCMDIMKRNIKTYDTDKKASPMDKKA